MKTVQFGKYKITATSTDEGTFTVNVTDGRAPYIAHSEASSEDEAIEEMKEHLKTGKVFNPQE